MRPPKPGFSGHIRQDRYNRGLRLDKIMLDRMFSALSAILPLRPKQAEQSDTRQEILRHDPDYERHRKKKEPDPLEAFEEGGVVLSVAALEEFLVNFMRGTLEHPPEENEASAVPSPEISTAAPPPPSEQPAATGAAAQAASAYQNMAGAGNRKQILLETTDKASGPPLELSAGDARAIHGLIEDLKILAAAGIQYLQIERAESFVQSLSDAVNKAKSDLS